MSVQFSPRKPSRAIYSINRADQPWKARKKARKLHWAEEGRDLFTHMQAEEKPRISAEILTVFSCISDPFSPFFLRFFHRRAHIGWSEVFALHWQMRLRQFVNIHVMLLNSVHVCVERLAIKTFHSCGICLCFLQWVVDVWLCFI